MKKNILNIDLLLKKKFSVEISGYNSTEVDSYLDKVIFDYKNMDDEIKGLIKKINKKNNLIELKDDEIQKLKIEIENLKTQIKEVAKASNYEILKGIEEIKNNFKNGTSK